MLASHVKAKNCWARPDSLFILRVKKWVSADATCMGGGMGRRSPGSQSPERPIGCKVTERGELFQALHQQLQSLELWTVGAGCYYATVAAKRP
jgi:hypothetical protein